MIISVFNKEGEDKAEKYSFKQPQVVIGRNPSSECSVVINSHTISRNHLKVRLNGTTIQLQDISSNGTYVNEELVAPKDWCSVSPNDRIKLAEFEGYLQFQIREDNTATKHQSTKVKRKVSKSASSSSSGDRSRQKAPQLPFKISDSTFRMLKDMTVNKKSKEERVKFLRLMGISKAAEYWDQIERIVKQKKGIKDKQQTCDNLQRQFNSSRSGMQKRGLGK